MSWLPASPPGTQHPIPAYLRSDHLLINRSTGGGFKPVSRHYINAAMHGLDITAQNLRADRLLAEAQASSGDPLQLSRLFGISDPTAIRYCADVGGGGLGRPLPAESSMLRQVP